MDIKNTRQHMEKVIDHFKVELKKVRTGRASASVLDDLTVEVYGQSTPLQHMANITTLDAQTLQVQPYDPSNLDAVSAAIRDDQSLGLNPSDDGRVVRIAMPPLTTERRQEIVKQIKERAEETRVSLRNVRHEELKAAKEQEKNKEITQDDLHDAEKQLNELVDEYNHKIEDLLKAKESEVMTV